MSSLKNWGNGKRGNITKLADGCSVTQPCASKWVMTGNLPFHYAKSAMRVTGLSAKEIYPDAYELFKFDMHKDGLIDQYNELLNKTEKLKIIMSQIENLHAEANKIMDDL